MIKNVAKMINDIDINMSDTLTELMERFYNVMRENGVSMVVHEPDGSMSTCSGEWIMCKTLFLKRIEMQLSIQDMINCPQDLQQ